MTAAGLGGTLAGEGPVTVFAPTNEAFAKICCPVIHKERITWYFQRPVELVASLTTDTELLKQVICHISLNIKDRFPTRVILCALCHKKTENIFLEIKI